MTITATEFKNNLGKYLDLASTEEIFISKNGKYTHLWKAGFVCKILAERVFCRDFA